jgi:hypothetical protein
METVPTEATQAALPAATKKDTELFTDALMLIPWITLDLRLAPTPTTDAAATLIVGSMKSEALGEPIVASADI